jgi:ketosteroid isomerase-like protein
MPSAEVERLKAIYTAIQRQDTDELTRSVAHDMEFEMPAGLPWGGVHHGQDGLAAVAEIHQDHVEGEWAEPEEFFEAGGRVVVIGRTRGRSRATGATFEVPFAHVWGMVEGYPSRFRGYFDTAPITAALNAPGNQD